MAKNLPPKSSKKNTPAASAEKKPCILVVDDDRIMRMMMVDCLEKDFEVREAADGKIALEVLGSDGNGVDVVLLDREMPVMNGMEVVERMQEDAHLRRIPIIMQTGSDQPDQVREGIEAGVFYYLTKPVQNEVLESVVAAALEEVRRRRILSEEMHKHRTSFGLIHTCQFFFKTIGEAEHLAAFIANCFPDPERTLTGLAALLVNAIEYGKLGLTYDEKTDLIAKGTWMKEMRRREKLPEYSESRIGIVFVRQPQLCTVTITDPGDGFDWRDYLEFDPSRASDNHGRGIAQANMVSFDELTFNDAGNEVIGTVNIEQELEW